MKILPGIGLDEIKFGMTESEIIQILGEPDFVDIDEDDEDHFSKEFWYSKNFFTCSFEQEDNYRLGCITILGKGHLFFGKDLWGRSKSVVKSHVLRSTNEILEYENWGEMDDGDHELLSSNKLDVNFWFDSDSLTEIQYGYLFEEDRETIAWPK